jgi:DNA-binding Lrp family transcriptional regulator
MRLQRGVPVAGVDPATARALARACHDHWSPAPWLADQAKVAPEAVDEMLQNLVDGGFLKRRDAELWPEETYEWNTTLAGGALTMASFLKPISRKKAKELLDAVLERAAAYNRDDAKPLLVSRVGRVRVLPRPFSQRTR